MTALDTSCYGVLRLVIGRVNQNFFNTVRGNEMHYDAKLIQQMRLIEESDRLYAKFNAARRCYRSAVTEYFATHDRDALDAAHSDYIKAYVAVPANRNNHHGAHLGAQADYSGMAIGYILEHREHPPTNPHSIARNEV